MATKRPDFEKVTVSLPAHLVRYADGRAAALGTSRSQVVSQALLELETRERDALAREGYIFYGEEAEAFAQASLAAVSEGLADAG
jgi:metal-responsive CopG/Arc/MetJ family transcriptional regulator